jgi:hypothetical protein
MSVLLCLLMSMNGIFMDHQIILLRLVWEKVWQKGKGPYSQDTTSDHKNLLLHTTGSHWRLDYSACRKVCIQQGSWLIANKRGFRHHVCHMVSLPQICTDVTSFKHITCILHVICFVFHSSIACVSPHYLWYVQLSCYRICRKTNLISWTCVFHVCVGTVCVIAGH